MKEWGYMEDAEVHHRIPSSSSFGRLLNFIWDESEEGEVNWGCAVVMLELGAFFFKSNVQWKIHPHAHVEIKWYR